MSLVPGRGGADAPVPSASNTPTPAKAAPQVSLVIAAFDAHETLGLQLDALAHQVDPPSFEVVVVDNGSPVSPQPVVDEWATQGLAVRLVRAGAHQGTAYARNAGVRQALAQEIAFCDADDCVGPRFVRCAHEALQVCDVVTGNVLPVEADEFVEGREHLWSILRALDDERGLRLDAVAHDYPILMGGASAIRRATFEALGGFDQTFFPGAEDNDLALRLVAAGIPIARHDGMTLAERRRSTQAAAFRRAFDAGRMHITLCARHDLWQSSPHLQHPAWYVDLAKMPLVAVKALATGADGTTRRAVAARAGLRLGQAAGMVRHRLLRRPVVSRVGIGLGDSGQ